jgi:hypothetical protein
MELRSAPTGRGTWRGEIAFAGAAVVLVLAILADTIFNFAAAGAFLLFSRRAYRKRMDRIILGSPGAAALVLAAAGFWLGGCESTPKAVPTGDPRSFDGQVQQLGWSVHATVDQSDSRKSMEDDLNALGTEKDWKKQLRFSAESLFLMPDGKKSLESDLRDLGASEKHGLRDTVDLLGW